MDKDLGSKTDVQSKQGSKRRRRLHHIASARLKDFDPLLSKAVDEVLIINSLLLDHIASQPGHLLTKHFGRYVRVANNASRNVCRILREQNKFLSQRSNEHSERAKIHRDNAKAKDQRWFERQKALIELGTTRGRQKDKD